MADAVDTAPRHESAHLHVSGQALYADDIALPADALHAAFGISAIAHGHIRTLDLAPVLASPNVSSVAVASDIPGENNYGSVLHDDPIFADGLVQYAGQPLFAVAARSHGAARKAARQARVDYQPLPAILDIRAALAAHSFVLPTWRDRSPSPCRRKTARCWSTVPPSIRVKCNNSWRTRWPGTRTT
jgi:xanthine dehydrogenase large subunit